MTLWPPSTRGPPCSSHAPILKLYYRCEMLMLLLLSSSRDHFFVSGEKQEDQVGAGILLGVQNGAATLEILSSKSFLRFISLKNRAH
jgi:hypothetical protein